MALIYHTVNNALVRLHYDLADAAESDDRTNELRGRLEDVVEDCEKLNEVRLRV